jgi:hypothetical protein
MSVVTLEIPESQVVDWVQRLSPEAKRAVLRTLIPRLEEFEDLVDYGDRRIRALCAERGLDWDGLSEREREQLVDDLLHETESRT